MWSVISGLGLAKIHSSRLAYSPNAHQTRRRPTFLCLVCFNLPRPFVLSESLRSSVSGAAQDSAEGSATMESWVPLFDIFLKSPVPESEASQWLHQSFDASSTRGPVTPGAFLSLLMKPTEALLVDDVTTAMPSLSSPTKRVMFMETLPPVVQARILSYLSYEHQRFDKRDLSRLAGNLLGASEGVDFWVQRAARNLFDLVTMSDYRCFSSSSLDFVGGVRVEFERVPDWLQDLAGANSTSLPWLPLLSEELNAERVVDTPEYHEDSSDKVREDGEDNIDEAVGRLVIDDPVNLSLGSEIQEKVASLAARIRDFESTSKSIFLANEISQLCLDSGLDSFTVLNLIEPWRADDETASVIIFHLANGSEEELTWPSQVLSSVCLPKLLVLNESASCVLVTAIVDYCKIHRRAAVNALLFPLLLRRGGINKPICDVVSRIVRECLHPAHVSAIFQKLLCGEEDDRDLIFPACYRPLISDELVWTESFFVLLQNILNQKVTLTQESVDSIVNQLNHLAGNFSKSVKFGNFILCLVNKCKYLLKSHKNTLTEAVKHTDTLVTKSIMSKLVAL